MSSFSNLFVSSEVTEYLHSFVPEDIGKIFENHWPTINAIDEFQLQILRVAFVYLFFSLICIWLAWGKYGEKITERFMKPASSKSLEDLKREATELKLPKEHTPRI